MGTTVLLGSLGLGNGFQRSPLPRGLCCCVCPRLSQRLSLGPGCLQSLAGIFFTAATTQKNQKTILHNKTSKDYTDKQ
jgi:hypothetical protein